MKEDIGLSQITPKDAKMSESLSEETKKTVGRFGKVSFDDYHAVWSGIATTKPVSNSSNPLSEVLKADSKLQAAHFGLAHHELQTEIHKQLAEHNAIMYGKFEKRGSVGQNLVELKATKIQLLKQIYLPKHQGNQDFTPNSCNRQELLNLMRECPYPAFQCNNTTQLVKLIEHLNN